MSNRFATLLLTAGILAVTAGLPSAETLNNGAVIKMAKAGLSEEIIVATINSQPGNYDVGVDELIKLKQDGISDKIVAAMVAKAGSGGASAMPAAVPAATGRGPVVTIGGISLPDELGIYYLKDAKYLPLVPEILNLRTARAASLFTSGVVAAKLNGWVVNPHGPNRLAPDTQLLVRLPEGTDVAEYVCLKFVVKDDRREVELGRGRINVSFSTHRSAIPFQTERLDKGVYRMKFGVFKAGEYGLLPPGANLTANAASAGKIYTFLVE